MSEELYYILYWTGIAVGLSGLMIAASGYQPMLGTTTSFTAVSGLLLTLSTIGLGVTIRRMLASPITP